MNDVRYFPFCSSSEAFDEELRKRDERANTFVSRLVWRGYTVRYDEAISHILVSLGEKQCAISRATAEWQDTDAVLLWVKDELT